MTNTSFEFGEQAIMTYTEAPEIAQFRKLIRSWTSSDQSFRHQQTQGHGRRKDFFYGGGATTGLFLNFFRGGQKWWNLIFPTRKLRKKIFCWKFQNPGEGSWPPCPPPFRHPCPQYLLHLISVKIRPNSTQWHLRPVNERWSSRGWWHEKQAENKAVENANVWNVSQTNKCTAVTGLLLRKLEEWRDNYIYRNIICVQSPTCPTSIVHHLTAVPLVSRH